MKVNQRAYKARPEPVGRSRRWWKEKGRADGQGQASGSNIPEMLNWGGDGDGDGDGDGEGDGDGDGDGFLFNYWLSLYFSSVSRLIGKFSEWVSQVDRTV